MEVVDAGSVEAREAMAAYFAELAARIPGGFDPGSAVDDAAAAYNPPRGAFVVARVDGAVAACGAVTFLDAEVAELKRMWVAPAARGAGLARRLLARLEEEAAAAGRAVAVLDTNSALIEAIALYESSGYVAIPRYNDNPYAERWFRKELAVS